MADLNPAEQRALRISSRISIELCDTAALITIETCWSGQGLLFDTKAEKLRKIRRFCKRLAA